MRNTILTKSLLTAIALAPVVASGAGGQFVVDDATIADPGRCEVEAWYERANGTDAFTVMPFCNFTGNLELGLGLNRVSDEDSELGVELAAKTLLGESPDGRFAWGLALATQHSDTFNRFEGAELYVPITTVLTDTFTVHTNLGWGHARDEDDAALWGIGADYALAQNLNLIAEAWGTHQGGTTLQSGLRYGFGEGHLDFSYSQARRDSDDNWWALGFAWAF